MDYPLRYDDRPLHPWRTAAFLAAAVAAVELILLIVVGGALIAKPGSSSQAAAAKRSAVAPAKQAAAKSGAATAKTGKAKAAVAELSRTHVKLLVLNGNGRQGAAAALAARASQRGYRIGLVANAPRRDFTRTLVMYRRGFEGEAVRLGRDLGIKIVGPLDGMRPAQLHGAHAVVVVGA